MRNFVIPAKAGIQRTKGSRSSFWIPACAGMTTAFAGMTTVFAGMTMEAHRG